VCMAVFLVVAVALSQFAFVVLTDQEIWENGVESKLNIVETALEGVISSNSTLLDSEALCGKYGQHTVMNGHGGELTMPDGTAYLSTDDAPIFYTKKLPSNTWLPPRQGPDRSVLDDALYVIHEGISINYFDSNKSGYSLAYLLTMFVWLFTLMVELRCILSFGTMLGHFWFMADARGDQVEKDPETGRFRIVGLPRPAKLLGASIIVFRLGIAIRLLWVGSKMLFFTTSKMELVLNAVALVFVLEMDEIVFLAIVSKQGQNLLGNIDPVKFTPKVSERLLQVSRAGTVASFMLIICACFLARHAQIIVFRSLFFDPASALCLFNGAPPIGGTNLVAPVPGFCESILSATCAPAVVGPGSRHGPCIVTDQTAIFDATVQLYLDGEVFEGMRRSDGTRSSWKEWGQARPELQKRRLWTPDPYLDVLRKNCLQMYQPTAGLLAVEDGADTQSVAPFFCARKPLFDKVFGEARGGMVHDVASYEGSHSFKVRSLQDSQVVSGVDACRQELASGSLVAMPPLARQGMRSTGARHHGTRSKSTRRNEGRWKNLRAQPRRLSIELGH